MRQLASTLNNVNRGLNHWFNTSAPFERTPANQPASYSVRVFPLYVDGVRGDKLLQPNANIHRDLKFHERVDMQLRVDVFQRF